MAEVIGTIGIEQVVLNNAATETTLKSPIAGHSRFTGKNGTVAGHGWQSWVGQQSH